jgi:hypothetical protein
MTLSLALVVGLNFNVTRTVSQPSPPPVDSWSEALLLHFPVRVEALNASHDVHQWAVDLSNDDPERAIAWLHFGHQHARRAWRYYLSEARLLWHFGDRREALAHAERALSESTDFSQAIESQALVRLIEARLALASEER